MRWLMVDYATAKWDWRTTRQLSQNAAPRQTVVVVYAKRALVSHRGSRLSHVRRDKLRWVGQPVLKPTPLGGFCRPWRHLEPQPLRWHPWSYRSTPARSVKSRKSFPSSLGLPARQRSATPSSRRYFLRPASP